jgi:hypothetical protein
MEIAEKGEKREREIKRKGMDRQIYTIDTHHPIM